MADTIVVRTNLPDFRRQLAGLGDRMQKNVVRSAARAAAAVYRDAARQVAPLLRVPDKRRMPGALRRSIYSGTRRGSPGVVEAFVGVRGKRTVGRGQRVIDAFYGRFLEFGWIPRGPGQRFRGGTRTRALLRERALKAGATRQRHPFLEPAFRRASGAALQAFNERMAAGLAVESRRST